MGENYSDIFHTHRQHSHIGPRKAFCHTSDLQQRRLAFSWSWVLEFLILTVTLSNSTHSKRTFLLPLGSRCQDLNYTIKQCQCIFTSVCLFFSPPSPLPTLIFFPLSLSYAHFEIEYHYSGKTDLGYELLAEASPRVENVCLHHHTCHDINVF